MNFIQIFILAAVQGLAELLPVSSSAHVIVAEKLMGLNPSSPEMTFLLVMLHTGTMFAVLIYFRKRWMEILRTAGAARKNYIKNLVIATGVTGVIGLTLKKIIEKTILGGVPHAEIEELFGNLPLIAASLIVVGIIIVIAGSKKTPTPSLPLNTKNSAKIGAIQGLCLPFRGFSRSGSTISTGLFLGISRAEAEEFSFALAVILTPPVIARELLRLMKSNSTDTFSQVAMSALTPGLIGMTLSFCSGLIALRWVSSWLENGKWKYFGYYCFAAAMIVLAVNHMST